MVLTYEKSVFINCPFDSEYEPLFHAIVLTVAARGFTPRCARETEGEADPRITRIARGLLSCKYSIHDLSRYSGEGEYNLARFNMPLELGIALGFRYQSSVDAGIPAREHNWVALVPENFVHHRYISDLAGYDVPAHDKTPMKVVSKVAAWLSIQPDFVPNQISARMILDLYPPFCEQLARSKEEGLGVLSWPEIIRSAESVVAALT